MAEAQRLAAQHPAVNFGVYELTATVRGEVKITVEEARGSDPSPAAQFNCPPKTSALPEVAPAVDLRTCVKGQGLRLRNGKIAEYMGHDMFDVYPHKTSIGSRTNTGEYCTELVDHESDVIEILPLHYPHLRPVPPELPPLPDGAVYLGMGGEFRTSGTFRGHSISDICSEWQFCPMLEGSRDFLFYAAPADSEIVRINREARK
jgi:hypothetical protein